MIDIFIFGAYSNICKHKVLKDLELIHNQFNNIYVYDMKSSSTELYRKYINDTNISNDKTFINKFTYIYGNFDIQSYTCILYPYLRNISIVYLGLPSFCYIDILFFFNTIENNIKIVLEKPVGSSITEFNKIQKTIINSKHSIILCDHYIYKCKPIINKIKRCFDKIQTLELTLHYKESIGKRTTYFDTTGLFIDIFHGHILFLLFQLLGQFYITDIRKLQFEKKKYTNYEGSNSNIDTFFFLHCFISNTEVKISCGKNMPETIKHIIINEDTKYIIKDLNEYSFLFIDIITNNDILKLKNNFKYQKHFWKITNYLSNFEFKSRNNIDIETY